MNRREFIKQVGKLVFFASLSNGILSCGGGGNKSVSVDKTPVYIGRASSYDEAEYEQLRNIVGEMVSFLYSQKPFFSYGDTVSIKPNLVSSLECLGLPAGQTYVAHSSVAKALGEVIRDLGAGRIQFVEGSTIPSNTNEVFASIGYDKVASYLDAELLDLNVAAPYGSFSEIEIEGGLALASVKVNHNLIETDCLISLGKLKCHSSAGVSLSLKNLIGLLPMDVYGSNGTGTRIETVHAPEVKTQIPYAIVDLARLFAADLSFIDGITSIERGEGPWVKDIATVSPGLLIAGGNSTAVDSVCTRLMGFNSETDWPQSPFSTCFNHIKLAAQYGLGPYLLDDIEVYGERIGSVMYPFAPP